MIDIKDYDKDKLSEIIEHAQQIAMAAINYIYDDIASEHTPTADELNKIHHALEILHCCNELIIHKHI